MMTTDDYDPELESILTKKRKKLEESMKKAGKLPQIVPVVSIGIQELNDSNFDQFIKETQVPVLVDIYADWCMPCKYIAPIIEKLSKKYAGRMVFAKLNADYNPRTTTRFQLFSIPTLMFFKNGKFVGRIVGAVPQPRIETAVRALLKANQ
ncbi:MAG: thioredoxin [Candidatus Heimdallarchaeota archaeon]